MKMYYNLIYSFIIFIGVVTGLITVGKELFGRGITGIILFLFFVLYIVLIFSYISHKNDKKLKEKMEQDLEFEIQWQYQKQQKEKEQFAAIQVSNVDSMTGLDFEKYLKKLLTALKYQVTLTKASGDFGVDLIASKENDKIAIQAKRQTSKVSRRAISDAVAGMHHYNCNKAMVITNNYFTKDAIKLAASTNCELVNRDTLANWMITARSQQ